MPMSKRDMSFSDLRVMALGAIDETTSDNHYGSLLGRWLNEGQQRMVMEGEGIEGSTEFTTVVGQRSYPLPDPVSGGDITRLKLVLYDGVEIHEHRLNVHDFASDRTGLVDRYALWDDQIMLGPSPPSEVVQVALYFFQEPLYMTQDTDIPDVPNRFRGYIADYATAQMLLADGRLQEAQYYLQSYEAGVRRYAQWAAQKTRGNFKTVANVME